jgi:hypothetical protein
VPLSKRPAARARQLANLVPGAGAGDGGHRRHLVHGGYGRIARRDLEAKEREVFEALNADLPLRESDGSVPAADQVVVRLLAEALVRLARVHDFVNERDIEDKKGRLRPAAELEVRLRSQALDLCRELGLTPAARARLGLDLTRAERARRRTLDDFVNGSATEEAEE